ncbi:MAG: SDR family NAD(P)-dependent oxidoreductase, partial [Clostridia bacterium]|nr:SDR family NAD(P)-dependent oxidoreductase [Clostridia bacterium]
TTSELAGQKPLPFNGIYTMTKSALETYADSLRLELQLIGVKVINIKPGAFDTQMVSSTDAQAKQLMKNTKLYKMGAQKFVAVMHSQTGGAKDPDVLAKVFHKALTAKCPRMTYYKNASVGLKLYSIMPRRLQAFVIRLILKSK